MENKTQTQIKELKNALKTLEQTEISNITSEVLANLPIYRRGA